MAGVIGGFLGLGGGIVLNPCLLMIGFDPLTASATSAFTVIFNSFTQVV